MFDFTDDENKINIANIFLKEQILLGNELKTIFKQLNSLYSSYNSYKIEKIFIDLNTSLETCKTNFNNNIIFIKKEIEKYEKIEIDAKKEITDLLENNNIKPIN